MISQYIDLRENKNYNLIKGPAESIKKGNLVLFPTETVYGLGATALDDKAVEKIFIAKGRAQDNPLIVHISNREMLNSLVKSVGIIEEKLIENFWPGPLTIIFKKKRVIPNRVTCGLDTVAIRMPSNKIARALIEYSGVPIAAPSANISGRPSGTVLDDIKEEFAGKVDYMIDGGKVDIGIESTVIIVINDVIHILRPGKITPENFTKLGFKVEVEKQVLGEYKAQEKVLSPGIKYKHYAPKTKCLVIFSKDRERLVQKINELSVKQKTVAICKTETLSKIMAEVKLDLGNSLEDVSSNIFTLLRKADKYDAQLIIVEGVDKEGLGLAIMNRLLRACSHNYIEI